MKIDFEIDFNKVTKVLTFVEDEDSYFGYCQKESSVEHLQEWLDCVGSKVPKEVWISATFVIEVDESYIQFSFYSKEGIIKGKCHPTSKPLSQEELDELEREDLYSQRDLDLDFPDNEDCM